MDYCTGLPPYQRAVHSLAKECAAVAAPLQLRGPQECAAAYGGPSESASKMNDPPCGLKYNEYSLPRARQVIMY